MNHSVVTLLLFLAGGMIAAPSSVFAQKSVKRVHTRRVVKTQTVTVGGRTTLMAHRPRVRLRRPFVLKARPVGFHPGWRSRTVRTVRTVRCRHFRDGYYFNPHNGLNIRIGYGAGFWF